MRQPVPIDELREQHREAMTKLARAAERWVQLKTAGLDTSVEDQVMREAERESRRLERRIRRRKT